MSVVRGVDICCVSTVQLYETRSVSCCRSLWTSSAALTPLVIRSSRSLTSRRPHWAVWKAVKSEHSVASASQQTERPTVKHTSTQLRPTILGLLLLRQHLPRLFDQPHRQHTAHYKALTIGAHHSLHTSAALDGTTCGRHLTVRARLLDVSLLHCLLVCWCCVVLCCVVLCAESVLCRCC